LESWSSLFSNAWPTEYSQLT